MVSRFIKKYAVPVTITLMGLSFLWGCSGNGSTDSGEQAEYPLTITLENQTKGTAFIVYMVDEDSDTTYTYSNPAKDGKVDYNIQKNTFEKDVKLVVFTSGIQFTVYAKYDKLINHSTTLIIQNDDGDGYVVTKK